jgi:hypothetical protein
LTVEPGAIRGTTFNEKILHPREIHPAYQYREYPADSIEEWLALPNLEDGFPPTKAQAATLFKAVGKRKLLPLQLPLRRDS